jgi:hypothetical protein
MFTTQHIIEYYNGVTYKRTANANIGIPNTCGGGAAIGNGG